MPIIYSYATPTNLCPKAYSPRFIVGMHRWLEDYACLLEKSKVVTNVWRTGAVLNKDGARAEVIELYHRNEIRIRVSGKRRRDLLTTIRYELDKIHATYKRLKWNTLVPCKCQTCKESQEQHFYKFKNLQERLDFGQLTVGCDRPPYQDVNISSLIDDVIREPMSQNPPQPTPRDQVFISYSHQDNALFSELKDWLKPLEALRQA